MHFDKSAFCGVIAPIVNPCREDEGLDDKALIANANRLLATKIKGLYINGGTGDAEKLTLEDVAKTQQEWIKDRTYTYGILGDPKDLDMKFLHTLGPVKTVSLEEIFGY